MSNSTAAVAIPQKQILAAGAGWETVTEANFPKRMIVTTQARDKSGKTHFGFTMPGPLAFINIDRGYEGVIDKFIKRGKRIARKNFIIDPTRPPTPNEWDAIWYGMRDSYLYAVGCGHFRSVFVDTGNAMWEAQRMEAFGKLTQVPPLKYMEVNAAFESVINAALNYPVNVCIAHRMKEEYANDANGRGQKTGNWSPTGYKDMKFVAQVAIDQAWDTATNQPMLRIDRSRFGMELAGTVLTGPMCNFPSLGMLIHGPESARDWDDGTVMP